MTFGAHKAHLVVTGRPGNARTAAAGAAGRFHRSVRHVLTCRRGTDANEPQARGPACSIGRSAPSDAHRQCTNDDLECFQGDDIRQAMRPLSPARPIRRSRHVRTRNSCAIESSPVCAEARGHAFWIDVETKNVNGSLPGLPHWLLAETSHLAPHRLTQFEMAV
jgi:hypothetical protein